MNYFISVWAIGWLVMLAFWFLVALKGYRKQHRTHTTRSEHRGRFVRDFIIPGVVYIVWWPFPVVWGLACLCSGRWKQSRERF